MTAFDNISAAQSHLREDVLPVASKIRDNAQVDESNTSPVPQRSGSEISYTAAISCIIVVAIALRPGIVSIGPLLPTICDQFGLSHAQASLLTSIPDVLMGALALPTPWLSRRFGRDRVILAALALLLVAISARAVATSTAALLITTAGVGAGIAIAGALIAGFVKASFPHKAAFFIGIYGTALAIGSTISAGATGPIASIAATWRLGAGIWAIPGAAAIIAWLYVERRKRGRAAVGASATRYALPLRNPTAWLIAVFFACDNLLFYAFLAWIAPMSGTEKLAVCRFGFRWRAGGCDILADRNREAERPGSRRLPAPGACPDR
jgi:CP family cyanate transporter-like MFS transporter